MTEAKGTLRLPATGRQPQGSRARSAKPQSLRVPCAAEAETVSSVPVPAAPEEALVTDRRAGLTPSELVERKLISLLKSGPVRVSHVQMISTGLARGRRSSSK
jgi:hypothetical protein